jgi:hypothetical protein
MFRNIIGRSRILKRVNIRSLITNNVEGGDIRGVEKSLTSYPITVEAVGCKVLVITLPKIFANPTVIKKVASFYDFEVYAKGNELSNNIWSFKV